MGGASLLISEPKGDSMSTLKNPPTWKDGAVYYTRGTWGVVIGPMFFGWVQMIVAGVGLQERGLAFFTELSPQLIFVAVSWFICAYLMTLKRFVKVDFLGQKLVTGRRHLFWWWGRSEPIEASAKLVFDVHEGAIARAISASGTMLYCRLRLVMGDTERVLWEEGCSPPLGNYLVLGEAYRKLGQRIARELGRSFEDQAEEASYVRDVEAEANGGEDSQKFETEKELTGSGFLTLFGVGLTGAGYHIATTDLIAPGLLFFGVGLVFFYGVGYLLFRKVSLQTDRDTGRLIIQRGWFRSKNTDIVRLDPNARVVVHPVNGGDGFPKSHLGYESLHSMSFSVTLYVNGAYVGIPGQPGSHFADVFFEGKAFSTASGIPMQLLGRASCEAYQNLLDHPLVDGAPSLNRE